MPPQQLRFNQLPLSISRQHCWRGWTREVVAWPLTLTNNTADSLSKETWIWFWAWQAPRCLWEHGTEMWSLWTKTQKHLQEYPIFKSNEMVPQHYLCLSITRVELRGAEPRNIPKIWNWQNQKYPQYYQIWGGEKPVSIPKIIRLFI